MSLITRISDLVVRVSTEIKLLKTMLNGNVNNLSSLNTSSKTNLVDALNELKSTIDSVSASSNQIDDLSSSGLYKTWSITKISSEISSALSSLTAGAPAALNTLDELAAALGDDNNFASTIATALSNKVRFDTSQTLTNEQKNQALSNIGAQSSESIGDANTNFVTTFETGLL